MPPSDARRSTTSSMKLRMKKIPRPLDFRMFSGASGSAISSGSNPWPWSSTRTTNSVGLGDRRERELDGDELVVVLAVAVLDGVDDRFADRDADPMRGVFIERGECRQPVADQLDEIQQLVITGDLQANRPAARQHSG